MEPLEAESLALSVIRHAFRDETRADRGATPGKRRLVDRAKIVLASQPFRRWTLSDIGREVGCSPVYLTQLFRQIERMPLYRYQLRLRLAAALDEIAECDDLTMLALDLGFSSHSHFTAAFRATYGRSPSAFREMIGRQRSPGTATR
jgi:AraC-like DNA-binding protein